MILRDYRQVLREPFNIERNTAFKGFLDL